jgi:hypothetical protein
VKPGGRGGVEEGANGADGLGESRAGLGADTVGATVSGLATGAFVGGAGGSAGSLVAPPCERRAADLVIRRDPHPGHVTMASGLDSGAIGVLQRGQFIFGGRASIS